MDENKIFKKIYLHVDLDAFFASVEQLDHPQYKGKPVIVGGLPGERRSVVSTASYEARKYGVHSAMSIAKAYQLCPNGIYLHGNFARYHEMSLKVMSILANYSPVLIQMSIDEAFLDLTGTEKLFGKATDTAKKIKDEVYTKTGLTVSIGLASTMYIAKVASGYRKPDGLTFIPEGKETDFMLSLPINKLWGIGEKTQNHIKAAGFKTNEQLYNKSEHYLQTLFGNNCGSYIYNALRGNKDLTFGEESKNHSISSETTYEFDLDKWDSIETALLILAQSVMFRMHDENMHSQTICLKMRYEDFTTVTIQEKRDQIFTSVEDLYSCALKLFRKKYEDGRAVRLLGISLHNVESNDIPVQKDLFNFDEEKKAKVEKAITSLRNKHPEIKIQKARSLKNTILTLFILPFFLLTTLKTYAQENTNFTQTNEDTSINFLSSAFNIPPSLSQNSGSLWNYKKNDTDIIFTAKGYWQTQIISPFNSSFGFKTTPTFSFSPPVINQMVDLDFLLTIKNSYYFETIFADEFTENTFAFGYKGNKFLKHARISNRGIYFPDYYSSSKTSQNIGGGNNQAPGLMLHFENDKLKSDFLLRYEMLEQKTKEYTGTSCVTKNEIAINNFIEGRRFILPDTESLKNINEIFIETKNGIYSDSKGRKYKKLSSSQYIILPAENALILSSDAVSSANGKSLPAIAVTFSKTDENTIKSTLGNYGTYETPGNAFLGEVQKYFTQDNSSNINLYKYSFKAKDSCDYFFTKINSSFALYLQYPDTFSPFADCSMYKKYYSSQGTYILIHENTSLTDTNLSIEEKENTLLINEELNYSQESYLQIINENFSSSPITSPAKRFPLAQKNPLYYLDKSIASYSADYAYDLIIECQTYTNAVGYNIGNKAVNGTVIFYVNGIADTGAKYNEEDGSVTPSVKISSSDKIKIVWSEDSSSYLNGTLAAGSGLFYNFTPSFTGDISFTTRWSISPQLNYSYADSSLPGFISLTGGLNYKKENLKASTTLSASLKNDNTSGTKRILSMDSQLNNDIYLNKTSANYLPENFAPFLNSRDFYSSIELNENYKSKNFSISGQTDPSITNYKIPLEWDFSSFLKTDEIAWQAITIDLESLGVSLSGTENFSIALKEDFIKNKNYNIYLQLGVNASSSFTVEERQYVPTWCISKKSLSEKNSEDVLYSFIPNLDASSEDTSIENRQLGNGWQEVSIKLNEEDKAFLYSSSNIRLIITADLNNRDENDFADSGILWIGPCRSNGNYFASKYKKSSFTVFEETQYDISLTDEVISLFNKNSSNEVQVINWKSPIITQTDIPQENDGIISLSRSFYQTDFNSYKNLSFYFKYQENSVINSQSTISSVDENFIAVFFQKIDEDTLENISILKTALSFKEAKELSTGWHKFTINLEEKKVYIDNKISSSGTENLYLNSNESIASIFTLQINTLDTEENKFISQASLFLDELHLTDSKYVFSLENKSNISYIKNGIIFGDEKTPLLKDFNFCIEENTSYTFEETNALLFSTNASLSLKSLCFEFMADSGFSHSSSSLVSATINNDAENFSGINTLGYSLKTEKPVFNLIDIDSSLRINPSGVNSKANENIKINFFKYKIPMYIDFSILSTTSLWESVQKTNTNLTYDGKIYNMTLQSSFYKKTKGASYSSDIKDLFTDTYTNLFSSGRNADKRTSDLIFSSSFIIPFASLKPSLNLSAKNSVLSEYKNMQTNLDLKIPFSIKKINLTAGYKNTSLTSILKSKLTKNSDTYFEDIADINSHLINNTWIFSFPFADLVSTSLENKMTSAVKKENFSSASSNSSIYLEASRKLFSTPADIFIPSALKLSLEKNLDISSTKASFFILKTNLNFSALNILGKLSQTQFFKWYEQEALSSSLSLGIKYDSVTLSPVNLIFSTYIQNLFYINNSSIIKIAADASYDDSLNWNGSTLLSWERKIKKSPLGSLAKLIVPKLDETKFSYIRKNSLKYSISNSTYGSTTDAIEKFTNAFSLSHSIDANFTKNITVTSGLSTSYSVTSETVMTLNTQADIGIRVIF